MSRASETSRMSIYMWGIIFLNFILFYFLIVIAGTRWQVVWGRIFWAIHCVYIYIYIYNIDIYFIHIYRYISIEIYLRSTSISLWTCMAFDKYLMNWWKKRSRFYEANMNPKELGSSKEQPSSKVLVWNLKWCTSTLTYYLHFQKLPLIQRNCYTVFYRKPQCQSGEIIQLS